MKIKSIIFLMIFSILSANVQAASVTDMGIYNSNHKKQTQEAQKALMEKQTTLLEQTQNMFSLGGISNWLKGFLPAIALPGVLSIPKAVVDSVSGKDASSSSAQGTGQFPDAKKITEVKNTELQQATTPEETNFTNSYETLPAKNRALTQFSTLTHAQALKKKTEASRQIAGADKPTTKQINRADDVGRVYATNASTDLSFQEKFNSYLAIRASSNATEALALAGQTSNVSNQLNSSSMLGGLGSLMGGGL